MKDESHHMKFVQRKALKSLKKGSSAVMEDTPPFESEKILIFKRPKYLTNKRKYSV